MVGHSTINSTLRTQAGSENMAIQFEWNDEKARVNIQKRGIPFELAAKVFCTNDVLRFLTRRIV